MSGAAPAAQKTRASIGKLEGHQDKAGLRVVGWWNLHRYGDVPRWRLVGAKLRSRPSLLVDRSKPHIVADEGFLYCE